MADSEPTRGEVFNLDKIRQLVELMKEHDLSELDLREAEQQIRLCRATASDVRVVAAPQVLAAPAPVAAPASVAAPAAAPAAAAADSANIAYVKSPMVGTFYSRPNPTAESFVKVGDHVTPETVVCIIEAMKVFNEIQAEVRGRVVAILCDDETPVEFGKPLLKIDTNG
ncbi:MAG TPA: acetyl-CoA carboxylase biotin carboxyl carrier protein [Pirellulaceae bacterium]|nr:acetyl-CoA carboxylase biotin carboxyl carrier protein [Pirellulaceae bacterium]